MATTLNANVITKDFDPKELTFTSVTTTSKSIEYAVDMTECKGPVDLIIDGSASGTDISLTVYGGSYPAAMADKVFTLTAGKCYTVSVSSGETITSICNSYGTSYSNNATLVNGLNGKTNMNRILVNQSVYIPVVSSAIINNTTTMQPSSTT